MSGVLPRWPGVAGVAVALGACGTIDADPVYGPPPDLPPPVVRPPDWADDDPALALVAGGVVDRLGEDEGPRVTLLCGLEGIAAEPDVFGGIERPDLMADFRIGGDTRRVYALLGDISKADTIVPDVLLVEGAIVEADIADYDWPSANDPIGTVRGTARRDGPFALGGGDGVHASARCRFVERGAVTQALASLRTRIEALTGRGEQADERRALLRLLETIGGPDSAELRAVRHAELARAVAEPGWREVAPGVWLRVRFLGCDGERCRLAWDIANLGDTRLRPDCGFPEVRIAARRLDSVLGPPAVEAGVSASQEWSFDGPVVASAHVVMRCKGLGPKTLSLDLPL